jgi:hypothetical protein
MAFTSSRDGALVQSAATSAATEDLRPVSIMGLSRDGTRLYLSDMTDDGSFAAAGRTGVSFDDTAGSDTLNVLDGDPAGVSALDEIANCFMQLNRCAAV